MTISARLLPDSAVLDRRVRLRVPKRFANQRRPRDCIVSVSLMSPVMPRTRSARADAYRRIGAMPTDSSATTKTVDFNAATRPFATPQRKGPHRSKR